MDTLVAMPSASWVIKLRALAADIKIHHSVFALPWAVLAAVLAASRTGGGLKIGQLGLIVVCMITARTVAMTANRLLDAKVDAANPRTARRAIPSGRLSVLFVLGSLGFSAAIFVAAAGGFWLFYDNLWPLVLSLPVLVFVSSYPFLKRFTQLCHYYLGASLALAPVCAWIAIKGTVDAPPFYMAGAVLLWTAGFDIIYACQDYEFDLANSLFSVPAKCGIAPSLWIARLTHIACVGFLILLGLQTTELRNLYWIGVGLATALLIVEHSLVKANDLTKITLAFFTINGIISLVIGTLGITDVLRGHRLI